MSKSIENNSKSLLVVGGFLLILTPIVFAFLVPLEIFKETGQIGDTIGGITSPISQFIGSLLVYWALKAQIDANQIIQEQVLEEQKKSQIQHELEQIHELYNFFERNISKFDYTLTVVHGEVSGRPAVIYGGKAIQYFIRDLQASKIDPHDEESLLRNDHVREILGIINSGKLILKRINSSPISDEDKSFYKGIILHELTYSIFPSFELETKDRTEVLLCNVCQIPHGNFPAIIYDNLQILRMYFDGKIVGFETSR